MLGWHPCSQHTPSPAWSRTLCFQSPGEAGRGSRTAWAAHGERHTPEKMGAGPEPTLPRKAPSGAPRAARSCNQAQAAQLQPLAKWQRRGWRKGRVCQGSRCASRDRGDGERRAWQHGIPVTGRDFGCWERTWLHSPSPPPARCPQTPSPKGHFQLSKPISRFTQLLFKNKIK